MSPSPAREVRGPFGGCWEWTGTRNRWGYGRVHAGLVHRLVFEAIYGFAPPVVMHRCDNPPCFRPDHLLAGDTLANNRDMASKGRHWQQAKATCPRGHEFDRLGNRGQRRCSTCENEAARRRWPLVNGGKP